MWTIINSVQDAISVVDENGNGILFNKAYLEVTGLQEADVLHKPAAVDIVEGESVHLKVLETGRPIRGVPMKVGRYKRHVMVSCAPLYIHNKLRGSVGIIHDVSEVRFLGAVTAGEAKSASWNQSILCYYHGEVPNKQAVQLAKVAAATPATVLLLGEGGTGKELFAHAIHHASSRQGKQFIRVNCSAFPESLLESELFGYSEGAFTGARKQGKKGIFEEADGGTIFLDEIGAIPSLQAKILRVLQEGEIVRIGEARPLTVDVRVIAATNADLEKLIEEGKFREDLYYRLNVFPIYIPSLVERRADIPLLAQYYLHALGEDYNRPDTELSPAAARMLQEYHWPGNVRELKNVMARALINLKKDEKVVETRHLMFSLSTPQYGSTGRESQVFQGETLAQQHARWEKNVLLETLRSTNGNKTEAARQLGISVRSLYNKLEKYGV